VKNSGGDGGEKAKGEQVVKEREEREAAAAARKLEFEERRRWNARKRG
jgi:hypothetical protein